MISGEIFLKGNFKGIQHPGIRATNLNSNRYCRRNCELSVMGCKSQGYAAMSPAGGGRVWTNIVIFIISNFNVKRKQQFQTRFSN
jgi:hypothetical protein